MPRKRAIPEQDLEDINKTFKSGVKTDALNKGVGGELISTSKGEVKQGATFTIRDYRGRILKHTKSLIPKGGSQIVIGHEGQLFEEIPQELRIRVSWFDSDFE